MLKLYWERGLTVFLYFGELCATRDDGAPLTEAVRFILKKHKPGIIAEIMGPHLTRISGEGFYGPALMTDTARRNKGK